jgi:DNA helicase HerA-like ATPase
MLDTQGKFFLGRLFDVANNKLADKALLYDPADLTTHGLVTGMTGSGKTGLCVSLLEEAALQNIPAIIIDPKGDLTNLLLHFPELAPQDFQPWLDADVVRREGKTLDTAAKETADMWKKGLGDWGIDRERLIALKNAAEFAIYTPGSDAGHSRQRAVVAGRAIHSVGRQSRDFARTHFQHRHRHPRPGRHG